ncbi:MAG: type I methionyl aminopeptidase [Oscillospiraceae bacterium]|nr:type I methionyl aminopeptidase [Oscillospiraceae bacterium]
MIPIKSPREIALMRTAGMIVGQALRLAERTIQSGVTTKDLDDIIRKHITAQGAKPSFLGYRGFPASACISVNEELIHGIPGGRVLCQGDIVGIDVGVCHEGFHADSAATFSVGAVAPKAQQLIDITRQSFYQGLQFCRKGAHIGDISQAIGDYANKHGYAVVEHFTGHGVGASLHEEPEIPNFFTGKRGARLASGMTLAIEPMIIASNRPDVEILKDGWTVVSADRALTAHYEHTVLITDGAPELLTAREGDVS